MSILTNSTITVSARYLVFLLLGWYGVVCYAQNQTSENQYRLEGYGMMGDGGTETGLFRRKTGDAAEPGAPTDLPQGGAHDGR